MLTEGSLHLVLYVPAAWEVLGLQHVDKVLPPHPHEVLERRVITTFTCFQDSFDHFLSVWVCLLLVAQLERLEATPTAEFDEVEDLAAVGVEVDFAPRLRQGGDCQQWPLHECKVDSQALPC